MRSVVPLSILFLSSIAIPAATMHRGVRDSVHQAPTPAAAQDALTPVVVELFTSEGCSSCPPADELLMRLAGAQAVAGAEVIALEEHVDYWNHLGWTDPFSSWEFTARQQAYKQRFDTGSVYTPQMVVDGSVEFAGGRESQAREVIARATQAAKTPVRLAVAIGSDSRASLQVTVGKLSGATARDRVEAFFAITEVGLHSGVTRGENAGREVQHSLVVRALRKIGEADPRREISLSASPTLKLDPKWKRENLRAVVFLQEQKSRRIIGAASVPLT